MSASVDTFAEYIISRDPLRDIKQEKEDVSTDIQFPLCPSHIKQENDYPFTDLLNSTIGLTSRESQGDELPFYHQRYCRLSQTIPDCLFNSTCPMTIKPEFISGYSYDDNEDEDEDPLKSDENQQFSSRNETNYPSTLTDILLEETLENSTLFADGFGGFTCQICNKSYQCLQRMTEHWSKHTHMPVQEPIDSTGLAHTRDENSFNDGEKRYDCNECGRLFAKLSRLKWHQKIVHTAIGRMRCFCKSCGKTFATPGALKLHMKRHPLPGQELVKYTCFYCKKSYSVKYTLSAHIKNKHFGRGKKKYRCKQCGRIYSNQSNLIQHVGTVHFVPKVYSCHHCDKSYSSPFTLNFHIKNKHSMPGLKAVKYNCFHCKKRYLSKISIISHLRNKHSNILEKRYNCNQCDRIYKCQNSLMSHMRTVHLSVGRRKRFSCMSCGRTYANSETLKLHTRRKHPLPGQESIKYTCCYCKKSYRAKYNLRVHIKDQHSIKVEMNDDDSGEKCDKEIEDGVISRDFTFSGVESISDEETGSGATMRHGKMEKASAEHQKTSMAWINIQKRIIEYQNGNFMCKNCGQSYNLMEDGNIARQVDFACLFCHISFSTRHSLMRHYLGLHKHAGFEMYNTFEILCLQCLCTVGRTTDIRSHRRNECSHPNLVEYLCPACLPDEERHKRAKLQNDPTRKRRIMRRRKIFPCEKCGTEFRSRVELTNHSISTCGSFECIHCSSKFMSRDGIKYHMRRTHPPFAKQKKRSSGTSVSCPKCGKGIKHDFFLDSHLKFACSGTKKKIEVRNTHSREFVQVISQSDYESVTIGSHLKGLDTFSCCQCGQRFDQEFKLNRHTAFECPL